MTSDQIEAILNRDWWRSDVLGIPVTRQEWVAFTDVVRAACSTCIENMVRYNISWCDRLDVAIASAPEVHP